MKKILIINIDPPQRSLYSLEVSRELKSKYPSASISLITVKGCEVLNYFNYFASIYFLDVEKIFADSRFSSNETLEKTLKSFLLPMLNDDWELIINLSINPVGAMLGYFLKSKKYLGQLYSNDLTDISSNSPVASILSDEMTSRSPFIHYCYLQKLMLTEKSDRSQNSAENLILPINQDLKNKFESIKNEREKQYIVLIDTRISEDSRLEKLNYLMQLYLKLDSSLDSHPVFYSSDTEKDSFLINRMRDLSNKDIHMISGEGELIPDILINCKLIITSDLVLKTVCDLVGKQSILIKNSSSNYLSDYSIVDKSTVLVIDNLDEDDVSITLDTVEYILKNTINNLSDKKIYSTIIHQNLPLLQPIGAIDIEFAKWCLYTKYIAKLINATIPVHKIDHELYLNLINSEKKQIQDRLTEFLSVNKSVGADPAKKVIQTDMLDSAGGILGVGIRYCKEEMSVQNISEPKKMLEKIRASIKFGLDFLVSEQ